MSDEPERRATEDLLAGFDRPGRSPRAPPVRLDFNPHAPATGAETVLVTHRRATAMWPWLLAAFLASALIGGLVLTLAMRPSSTSPPPVPSSSDVIPLPVASTTVEQPPSSSIPSSATPPATTAPRVVKPATSTKKPEHRGDFVPEL